MPYKDWFQHHQPFSYVIASLLLPFSGLSFVRFRIALSVFYFVLTSSIFIFLWRRFGDAVRQVSIALLITLAFSGTYYWGHMLLADSLASYLLLPGYLWLVCLTLFPGRLRQRDLLVVSLSTFFTLITSMTYIYVVIGLNIYALYLYFSRTVLPWNSRRLGMTALIFIGPYIVFFLLLIVTGSVKDYYLSNVVYNQYYVYNYPRPAGTPINPIRYGMVILENFINNYYSILSGVFKFAVGDPFNMALALSNAAFGILLIVRRNYSFLFPFLIAVIFSNARSNPAEIHETDYQASVYILTSFANGIFALYFLRKIIDSQKHALSTKMVSSVVLVILGIYWFFNSLFIGMKFFQKFYPKYMGTAPFIYDDPQITSSIHAMVHSDEYVWIGPFEFKELFYLKRNIPSKFHWFLQPAAQLPWYQDRMLSDFREHKPVLIVFNRHFAPWGGDAAGYNGFFTSFLDQEYIRLFEINEKTPGFNYKWKIGNTPRFNIEDSFHLEKDKEGELLDRFIAAGLIEKIPKH